MQTEAEAVQREAEAAQTEAEAVQTEAEVVQRKAEAWGTEIKTEEVRGRQMLTEADRC